MQMTMIASIEPFAALPEPIVHGCWPTPRRSTALQRGQETA